MLLGASQGAFTAAPYIIAREVNEPKDMPKSIDILSSCIAICVFGGSILADFLADSGQIALAILFPIIPLVIVVLLIALNLQNKKIDGKVKIDIPGIIILATLITAFFLSMNFGGKVGWGNHFIIGGFVLTAILLFIFVKIENKSSKPVIPMHLFKNKQYVSILLLGILSMYYLSSMNAYSPLAVQQVLGASATTSGSLQLPRTIIIIVLPTFVGI